MKVYAVMIDSWNGEHDVTSIYAVYLKEEDASSLVAKLSDSNYSPAGKKISFYSPEYWVEEIEVID